MDLPCYILLFTIFTTDIYEVTSISARLNVRSIKNLHYEYHSSYNYVYFVIEYNI